MKKYLCIHAHFYQPPRESPWTGEIATQHMAFPYHDWNERINAECYAPNSVARIMSSTNQIKSIVNNYLHLSFNFGPTLLSWMEKKDKTSYNKILEADKRSIDLYEGHGNAIAQCYNHMIMPLAGYKDKLTQVLWGIEDFLYRFKRYPEGMWLPETAVDRETLSILALNKIKFIVLSPYQAHKIRELKDDKTGEWMSVEGAKIDPSRAYRYNISDDKYIDIFFYDANISQEVAFGNLLKDGATLSKSLQQGYSHERHHPQLLNIGTDGETYGHHFKFGEMVISFAVDDLVRNHGIIVTNYGQFLEQHPPTHEVDIFENSSWSCFHGLGRWQRDCGCRISKNEGWNQKWRKGLRKSLNKLKKRLDSIYEENITEYIDKAWDARDAYIKIVLDSSYIAKYFKLFSKRKLDANERVRCLKLLEMQRQSMFMFTSCGWFFDDISGIETVQILKHACRSLQLAEQFGYNLEEDFLEGLYEARSNIVKYNNGKYIYNNLVKTCAVDTNAIVAHYAIKGILLYQNKAYEAEPEEIDKRHTLYSYTISDCDRLFDKNEHIYMALGHARVHSDITLESSDVVYAVFYLPNYDVQCKVGGFSGAAAYESMKKDLVNSIKDYSITSFISKLDNYFSGKFYSLEDALLGGNGDTIKKLVNTRFLYSEYNKFYRKHKSLMELCARVDMPIDKDFKAVSKHIFSAKLVEIADSIIERKKSKEQSNRQSLKQTKTAMSEIELVVNESKRWDVELDTSFAQDKLSRSITRAFSTLDDDDDALLALEQIHYMLYTSIRSKLNINLWQLQNAFFNKASFIANKDIKIKELFLKTAVLLDFEKGFIQSLINHDL